MPVLYTCQNVDAVAWFHLNRFFSFFLIIPTPGCTDQYLPSAALCMVDMPVVSASRFEGHIKYTYLRSRNRSEKALSRKILCISIVRCPYRKYHFSGMCPHSFIFIW